MPQATPSEVLYDMLRRHAHINNRDVARILLSNQSVDGKPAPRLKVTDKTFLSRRVVHVIPGKDKIDPEMFRDFTLSVPELSAAIATKTQNALLQDSPETKTVYRETVEAMARALDAWGADGNILRNAIDRIAAVPGPTLAERFVLGLLGFTVSGCLADPVAAVDAQRSYSKGELAVAYSTMETEIVAPAAKRDDTQSDTCLGLIRVDKDGTALSQIYPLSKEPSGNVIGSFAQGPNAITDVGVDVSHEHVRIEWNGEAWIASGMGSTNGTILTSQTGTNYIVEPPKAAAASQKGHRSERLHPGDLLSLGSTTKYLVMEIDSSSFD